MAAQVKGVHLVGSFPHNSLHSAYEVFQKSFELCPGRIHSIPDGELGDERWCFIRYEDQRFPKKVLAFSNMQSADKLDPTFEPKLEDVSTLQWDEWAASSYAEFIKARDAGIIPEGIRFQVSLPAPVEPIIHVHHAYSAEIEPLYEQRMIEMLQRLQEKIPAKDLAIQWDLASGIAFIEMQRGRSVGELYAPLLKGWNSDPVDSLLQQLKRCTSHLSRDIPVGFHLCYGDLGNQHYMEPESLDVSVEVANLLVANIDRPIAWVHMPVPKTRDDLAYFAPLDHLKIEEQTLLYLGLIHFDDLEGTRKRIATASQVWKRDFGVATECGMGRTPPEQLDALLRLSAEVAQPY